MFQLTCQVRSDGKWTGEGQPICLYECDGQRGLKGELWKLVRVIGQRSRGWRFVCVSIFFSIPCVCMCMEWKVWSQDEPHDFFRISLQHVPQLPSYIMYYCMQIQLHRHI